MASSTVSMVDQSPGLILNTSTLSSPRNGRGTPKQLSNKLPWLELGRNDINQTGVANAPQNDRRQKKSKSESASARFKQPPPNSNGLFPNGIKAGDARRPVVERFDGNAASSLSHPQEHTATFEEPRTSTLPPRKQSSLDDLKSAKSHQGDPAPGTGQQPTRRLASMVKDLRPTDSTSSVKTGSQSSPVDVPENRKGSVGDSTTVRPSNTYLTYGPASTSRTGPSDEENHLRDSIAKLEKLTREAVFLAHDAVDRHRPDEVPRIMDEAAKAIHSSQPTRELQHQLRQEPLLDAGGAVPYPHATHTPRDEDASTYSRTSSNDVPQLAIQSPIPNPFVPLSSPFKSEPSPYRPPDIVSPAPRDFAYPTQPIQDQVSPTSTPPIDMRRRSKPKPRFDQLPGQENAPRASVPVTSGLPFVSGKSPAAAARPRASSTSSDSPAAPSPSQSDTIGQVGGHNWGSDKYDQNEYLSSNALDGKHHVMLGQDQKWSIHHHKRQPIARNWSTPRKRATALVVCLNTALIGFIIGVYAGEVPAIQYNLNDLDHHVILGNVVLYAVMAVTTFIFWPLPLLHGRKPYNLLALGITLPLQLPQAIMVGSRRVGDNSKYMTGLLVPRALSGLALGFCQINLKPTLLDLFGASLQSAHPHGEIVVVDDVRRHGGGMGLWIGFWSFCFIGSLALGFMIGADIVSGLNLSWGFYITIVLIAVTLFLNVITPETRRSPHRRTMAEIELPNMKISRRVARGEVRMHLYGDGPKWWWEEVSAGIHLSMKMLDQPGFGLMALYLGWIYGEIVLIIVVSIVRQPGLELSDVWTAPRKLALRGIPLASRVCRPRGFCHLCWGWPCYTQHKGKLFQQVSCPRCSYRQHDV